MKKDQVIELERDSDGIYKPSISKPRNPAPRPANVKKRNDSKRGEKSLSAISPTESIDLLQIFVDSSISQLKRETKNFIKRLFR